MRHLVISTSRDPAVEPFYDFAKVVFADEKVELGRDERFDSVYLRMHFCHPNLRKMERRVRRITRNLKGAYFLNDVRDLEGLRLRESKMNLAYWLGDLMPRTYSVKEAPLDVPVFCKKNISRCGHDVFFSLGDVPRPKRDWVAQERLEVLEELRIYVLFGEVVEVASVRRSLTEEHGVKVVGARKLSEIEMDFAREVLKRLPRADLVGLDVARLRDGYKVIEVNWTPVFYAYQRETGVNLAERIYGDFERRVGGG